MVAPSTLLMVLGAAAAAAVAATVDGVLVLGRDGRWSTDEPVSVGKKTSLLLLGSGLAREPVSFTSRDAERGSTCKQEGAMPRSSMDGNGSTTVVLPWQGRWFFCLRNGNNWVHQGRAVSLTAAGDPNVAVVSGVRGGGEMVSTSKGGYAVLPVDEEVLLLLLGTHFSELTRITLTTERSIRGVLCREQVLIETRGLQPLHGGLGARVTVRLPHAGLYYVCVSLAGRWVHQGADPLVTLEGESTIVPFWFNLLLVGTLLVWSGLFSGLTLGLMALDKTELKVIESCGTPEERDYARKILPLRRRGNYLLCSLVLGNVCVNSSFTILLDEMLSSGPVAVLLSTLGIVMLGEIIPQAICSRYGLAIGARTILITKLFMIITFPLSWPISKLLDSVLGEEIGNVFDREKLTEYLRITKDYAQLENEELNIIFGALELTKKTAADIMTRIEDVYMLPYDAVLDFETMSEIVKRGYTRIPVYDGSKQNIVSLLNTKDLTFVDPDDAIPLATVCTFYKHPLSFVFEDETLDSLLREFKKGHSHMAFVRQVVQAEDRDPAYHVTGLVTLEDVIEEIIQSEIIDETDVLMDNRRKQRRKDAQLLQDFSDFLKIGSGQQGKNVVSAQLAFATYQFLSTGVRAFTSEFVTPAVLRRLMAQNIFFSLKPSTGKNIFDAGKPCDFFTVILEGRVRVTVGKESLVFEAGPFSYFGLPALERGSFVPDYTVTPLSCVVFMKIGHSVYMAALRASRLGRPEEPPAEVAVQETAVLSNGAKQTPVTSTELKTAGWSGPAKA
ncbi:unextended protein-like isoform X1 [Amblyomma americanum]|uniref:Metal transporter cnnm2-like protein n=1 Tax=Amblyomma americanum TaxID=6943 RepID=A0AAQ4FRE2_AMBAM